MTGAPSSGGSGSTVGTGAGVAPSGDGGGQSGQPAGGTGAGGQNSGGQNSGSQNSGGQTSGNGGGPGRNGQGQNQNGQGQNQNGQGQNQNGQGPPSGTALVIDPGDGSVSIKNVDPAAGAPLPVVKVPAVAGVCGVAGMCAPVSVPLP